MNSPANIEARSLADVSAASLLPRQRAEHDKEPVLLSYWFIILRRKFVIIPIVILTLVAGLVITLLTTPKYTASARVEISKTRSDLARIGEAEDEGDKLSDLTFYQTQYGLLRARSLAERVARSLRLVDNAAFYQAFDLTRGSNSESDSDGRPQPLTAQQREEEFSKVVNILLNNQVVSPVRDSSLIDVRFTSADPAISTKVANAWVEQFIQANMDQRFAATSDARTFLERRLEQLRRRLEQSERDLVNYSSSQEIVALSTTVGSDGKTRSDRTLTGEELEAFSRALSQATADRIAAESRLGKGESATTQQSAGRSEGLTLLRQRRAEVAADYAKMMVQFAPDYPPAAALKSQIESLDRAIDTEKSRIGSSVTNEYQEALSRERQLSEAVEQLKDQLSSQQRRGIQANIYQREVDTNRQLYDSLLQRYKEIGVAGVGTNNVLIIDEAKIPQAPSSPNLLLNTLVALMLGCIIAGGVTFALEQIDETIKNPGDLARSVGEPLLGAVPHNDSKEPMLLDDPKSSVAEAYFSALTNLRFSTDHGVPRSLLVTSTRAAEGKSTSAAALARSIGRTGRSVVLVDGDMRSPSLHHFFGTDHEHGLSNFLSGERDLDPLLLETGWYNVHLMTSGPQPPNAAELLSGVRLRELLAALTERFDHVVVDAPPLLGLADAPLMSEAVEGVVFIVSASGPSTRLVKNALSRLRSVNAHVFGVVLTKFRAESTQYGYGYNYEYGYGQNTK